MTPNIKNLSDTRRNCTHCWLWWCQIKMYARDLEVRGGDVCMLYK